MINSNPKPNLYNQLRIVVILIVGIGIITTVTALSVVYWSEVLQRRFLDSLVMDEFNELLEHLASQPDAPLPEAAQLDIWLDGHKQSRPIPPELDQLPYGAHHDVSIGEGVYHVLKTAVAGSPTYVAIETSYLSKRERWLQSVLAGIAFFDVPLALIIGLWLVRRIALPHERLAERVSELDPSKDFTHIGKDFAGLEVEQIAAAIDNYQDRLSGFIDRERSFTASASHELRTPLASMLTSAEVLHQHPKLPAELQTYTGNLARNAIHMGKLLNGLMWLSRENQNLDYQKVDIEATVRNCSEPFQDKTINIEIAEDDGSSLPEVTLPQTLFDIVIANLLRNAWQFSPADGEITVTLERSRISIHNRGPHIPAEKLDQIFRMNYRSEISPGQGLGLYIASSICQRLGWSIKVSSDTASGTLVVLEFCEYIPQSHEVASRPR